MMTQIINGRIIKDGKITEGSLYFADGKILCPCQAEKLGAPDRVIDAKGNYVSAGFIDLHLHGGGGYDFLDGTEAYNVHSEYIHLGQVSMLFFHQILRLS